MFRHRDDITGMSLPGQGSDSTENQAVIFTVEIGSENNISDMVPGLAVLQQSTEQ